jgi:predicted phosphodiesterase
VSLKKLIDKQPGTVQTVTSMKLVFCLTRRRWLRLLPAVILPWFLSACHSPSPQSPATIDRFSFLAAGDMRNFVKSPSPDERYFDGLCEAAARVGAGSFMVVPGDFDPPGPVRAAVDQYLGPNYLLYPVVGNHEIETPEDMAWVQAWADRGIPHLVREGPPGAELTTYSFDFGNSHFVAVNDYFDNRAMVKSRGAIAEATLAWLENDLATTKQQHIWVIGHQPIESLPDMDTGRVRHHGESVSTNSAAAQRFVALLQQYRVRAYLCGHTHNASVAKVRGIWQADSGHGRGAGDKGSPSTFLKFRVKGPSAWVDVYRSKTNGMDYQLRKTVELN